MNNISLYDLKVEVMTYIALWEKNPDLKPIQKRGGKALALIALIYNGFTDIHYITDDDDIKNAYGNLNTKLYGNIVAEKDGKKYIIAIRTRAKYQSDEQPNPFIKNLLKKKQEKILMGSPSLIEQRTGAIPAWVIVIFDGNPKGLFFSIYFGTMEKIQKHDLYIKEDSLRQYECFLPNLDSRQILPHFSCDILIIIPLVEEFDIFKEYCEVMRNPVDGDQ